MIFAMYKVSLYIDGQRADLFEDENIEMTLTTQNVKDISKVFGDYSNGFTLPASPTNNAIFKHYYNVDVVGGFTANLRADAFIEVNNNLFKQGVLELEEVKMKQGEPYAYSVSFYSNTTALKDLFGEDTLNDLDLSAQDHDYNDTNIETGINNYVANTGNAIIYPMITPVTRWYWDSQGSHGDGNIHYHNDPDHGVFYYDLKPAIKLQKIIDAIETKYDVTFNSDFFDSADFGKLFMWCHRRAGYMFKDQPIGATPDKVNFTSGSGGDFNLTTDEYEINSVDQVVGKIQYSVNSTSSYKVELYINNELFTYRNHTGNVSNVEIFFPDFEVGDKVQMRFSPPDDWDASTVTLSLVSAVWYENPSGSFVINDSVTTSGNQVYSAEVVIADQMPEQKVSDFIGSLLRAFNLVVVPTAPSTYDIEPLDDWYSEGTTREISEYVDTEEVSIKKAPLYRRINFSYNETGAILGEEYRLQNDIGYGDLRADFAFDGEEFEVEVGFDNMLFERLKDSNPQPSQNLGLTELNVGQCVTREGEPYIGQPIIFYAAGNLRVNIAYHWSYTNMSGVAIQKQDMWLVGNVNSDVASSVTKTINFGTEIDPYLLQGFSTGLYDTYWKDYITDLYDASRRVFTYKAQLPLGIMLNLKNNDKLTILERNYIINSIKLNLTTGEASLELLNDV